MGVPVDGGSTKDRNCEDMREFIPLVLDAGTVKVFSPAKGPPVRPGSADCGAGAEGMQPLTALPGPDRPFPIELRVENGISAFPFHGKCF